MRVSVFYSAAFAAVASAQSSSVDPYPQTTLLRGTNSLGVVTAQPPVATLIPSQPAAVISQPAIVTSQPLPANIPAVGPGVHTLVLAGTGSAFNTTRTIVVSANNSTTVQIETSSAAASGSGSAGTLTGTARVSGSATGTGAPQNSAGAAANVKAAAGSVLGFGAIVAAFL
ncbi:hypothetical protein CC86DRAFT_461748 [Ophiobolus disseminans]|uniref:Uncharacterized protein n=1 Tax=Ophiobolus disseminans TaxID=1469910 RepID=A0A6A7AJR2_9PLEO|nr:hypothetical protein CC86DRAFT_461748 [Ophiobolus disseminans]